MTDTIECSCFLFSQTHSTKQVILIMYMRRELLANPKALTLIKNAHESRRVNCDYTVIIS